MQELKEIIRDIGDKLDNAEMYAKEAVKHKTQYPSLAGVYCRIAQDDLTHVEMLHKQAVDMIGEKQRSGVSVPPAMQAVWDYEHEKQIEDAADVRRLIDMYKG